MMGGAGAVAPSTAPPAARYENRPNRGDRPLLPLSRSSSLLGVGVRADDDVDGNGGAQGPTVTEVPILYHDTAASAASPNPTVSGNPSAEYGNASLAVRRRRFVLDDASLTVVEQQPVEASPDGAPASATATSMATDDTAADPAWLSACASASVHELGLSGVGGGVGLRSRVLVTTAAAPEDPAVLLLSVLPMGMAANSSASVATSATRSCTVELDTDQLSQFGRPVKIASFVHRRTPTDAYAHTTNLAETMTDEDDMRSALRYTARGHQDGHASSPSSSGGRSVYRNLGPALRLVLVDTAGTVLSVLFALSGVDNASSDGLQLQPLSSPSSSSHPRAAAHSPRSISVHSIPALIDTSAPNLYITAGSTIGPNDVGFLSPTRIVLALSPHLLCVDLVTSKVVPWTMAAGQRRKTIAGIISQAGSLLVGKRYDEDDYIDGTTTGGGAGENGPGSMAATSALCVVTHREEEDEQHQSGHHDGDYEDHVFDQDDWDNPNKTTIVFSLHADGTVRMWSVERTATSSSLQPRRVRLVQVPGEMSSAADASSRGEDPPLPPPSTWSSDAAAVSLAGRLYYEAGSGGDLRYALAVAVRTAEDPMAGLGLYPPTGTAAGNLASPLQRQHSPPSPSQRHLLRQDQGASSPPPSPCHVLVLSGSAAAKPGLAGTDGAVPLVVPPGSTDVVGMQFAPSPGSTCELHALYATKIRSHDQGRGRGLSSYHGAGGGGGGAISGSVLAFYPPSALSAVGHAPARMGPTSTIDYTALAERDAILSLGIAAEAAAAGTGAMMDSPGSSGSNSNREQQPQTLEKATASVDAAFMAQLFRPTHARSAGGMSPSAAAVRRAIERLVPSYRIGGGGGNSSSNSVEVDALLAVREWSRAEEARIAMTGTQRRRKIADISDGNDANAPFSERQSVLPANIYRAFATPGRRDRSLGDQGDGMDIDIYGTATAEEEEEDGDEAHASKVSTQKKVASHRSRWTSFLLAVFEEEAILRIPLCLASISPATQVRPAAAAESAILVRGRVTSCVVASCPRSVAGEEFGNVPAGSVMERLDDLSMTILRYVKYNGDKEHQMRLVKTESHVSDAIAKANLILEKMDQGSLDQMSSLGSWAISEVNARNPEGTATTIATITSLLEALTPEDINFWLSASFHTSATVRPFLPISDLCEGASPPISVTNLEDAARIASCSAYLASCHIDAIREITLGRCLLLFGVHRLTEVADDCFSISSVANNETNLEAVLRAHLEAAALQWTISQKVVNSPEKIMETSLTSSPPEARARTTTSGSSRASVSRSGSNMTTLEAHLLDLATSCIPSDHPAIKCQSGLPMSSCAIGAALAFVRTAFGDGPNESTMDNQASKPELEQLGALSRGMPEQPRLALRLLAPSISYPPPLCDLDKEWTRTEIAAECLLIEATFAEQNGTMDRSRIFDLRERASVLLRDSYASIDNEAGAACNMNTTFEVLCGVNQQCSPTGNHIDILEETMQQILSPSSLAAIKLLCKMQTFKSLFLPWIVAAEQQGTDMLTATSQSFPESVSNRGSEVKFLAQVLLRVSNLMHRITILERHCSAGTGLYSSDSATSTDIILTAIDDTICTLKDYVPHRMIDYMVEYATLWSSSFRHAQQGRKWAEAYAACLANPIKERRLNNFRRLVVGMADSGAFQEFLNMILTVVDGNAAPFYQEITDTKEMDLYEIAAETLANASFEQSRRDGVSKSSANYGGCLYALHASRGNWRRAAQAMSFYDIGARLMTSSAAEGQDDISTVTPTDRSQIIDDISISCLGSAQCIQLVDKQSHRFIVKDELGPYPLPPFFRDAFYSQDSGATKNKRGRDGLRSPFPANDATDSPGSNRVSHLMTETDLVARSMQGIALRTLSMDAASSTSALSLLGKSPREMIDSLARLGYYNLAVAVAKTLRDETGGSRPKGVDVFYNAVAYAINQYLIAPSNLHSEDEMLARPTIPQLYSSLESFPSGRLPGVVAMRETWMSREVQYDAAQEALRMELLRCYTVSYANKTNTLALEVAEALLDMDCGRAELPLWLVDLLLGRKQGGPCVDGLFANSASSTGKETSSPSSAADPAGLVRLFMNRGLYVQACDAVVSVLLENANRKQQATSRLPEKGGIDFVPYNLLDMLHNMIEAAVNTLTLSNNERGELLNARKKMENALEQHFECMKLSEEGLQSARALSK